jgi:cell division protein FtsL
VSVAVLLAVVATAVVSVCQRAQARHLKAEVYELERRHERLDREIRRIGAALEQARTPKSLLEAHDRLTAEARDALLQAAEGEESRPPEAPDAPPPGTEEVR